MIMGFLLFWLWSVNLILGLYGSPTPDANPALIAYDCNQTALEVLTYDLNRVESCPEQRNGSYKEETITIQVIQKKESDHLLVQRCHIVSQRLLWHCGMHDHSSIGNFNLAPEPHDISAGECQQLHTTGKIILHGQEITGVKSNQTTITHRFLAGGVWGEGYCHGGSFSDGGYTFHDVVVKQGYTITLQEQYRYYKIGTEEVVAFGGVSCRLERRSCYDHEVGRMIWRVPEKTCHQHEYDSLYAGSAKIVTVEDLGPQETYLHVSTNRKSGFQLFTPVSDTDRICGIEAMTTPYAGLYVVKYAGRPPFDATRPLPPNVDLIRYIEAKFMTYAYGSSMSVREIVQQLARMQCEVHRETLLNRLHIVAANPSSANLLVGNKPGIFGRVAGEVVHLLHCPAVEVRLRKASGCSLEIPIHHLGRDLYMDPRTRIITDVYTYKECGILTPVMFRHGASWVRMSPFFSPAEAPKILAPNQVDNFPFHKLVSYAQGGIYDPEDLQQLRDFMLFSNRRDAMSSNILAGLEGFNAPNYDLTKVLHPDGWKTLAKDRLRQMWGSMQIIGEYLSGFIGIYFCLTVIRVIISAAIRVFSIYRLSGCTWQLLCGCWSCLSSVFWSKILQERTTPVVSDTANVEAEVTIPLTEQPTPIATTSPYFKAHQGMSNPV